MRFWIELFWKAGGVYFLGLARLFGAGAGRGSAPVNKGTRRCGPNGAWNDVWRCTATHCPSCFA